MKKNKPSLLDTPLASAIAGLGLVLLLSANVALAQTPGLEEAFKPVGERPLCGPEQVLPPIEVLEDEQVHIQSDRADMSGKEITIFSGAVRIQRADVQLEADHARYYHLIDKIEAEGNVRLRTPDLLVSGSDAAIHIQKEQGVINNVHYQTADAARGKARQISVLDPARVKLEAATYTTCIGDQPDWLLSAESISLNNVSRQGHATHSVVRFKGVPIFYMPYMRFPIGDARLTGLLYPSFGTSERNGTELKLPFYWNIAPHRDATITPWYMRDRGAMLLTEFRYLNPENYGQMEVDYLDKDKIYDHSRRRLRWRHQSTNTAGWFTEADYNRVTDDDHFIDFGNSLTSTSITHLEQKGALGYLADNWTFRANVQAYQSLTGGKSYERLPQLLLNTHLPERDNQWHFGLDGEWVNFYRDDVNVQGSRLNLVPYVSLPLRNEAMFLTPKLALHYTQYDLTHTAATEADTHRRSLPVFSLDSGIFFERNFAVGDEAMVQTLEPQLFYVYTPYESQDDIPVFDTGEAGFTINDPFRENRFTGPDRVEDADRLSAMLTTRFISEDDGTEYFMARIGQTFYFDDREVTLSGAAAQTRSYSPYIAEVIAQPSTKLYMRADAEWDPQISNYTVGNLRLDFLPDGRFEFHADYRYQRDSLETSEGKAGWRVTPRWRLEARKLYDIRYHRKQESEYSLRYDSCCWGFKLSTVERFISQGKPYDSALYLELELKGLSSFVSGI